MLYFQRLLKQSIDVHWFYIYNLITDNLIKDVKYILIDHLIVNHDVCNLILDYAHNGIRNCINFCMTIHILVKFKPMVAIIDIIVVRVIRLIYDLQEKVSKSIGLIICFIMKMISVLFIMIAE